MEIDLTGSNGAAVPTGANARGSFTDAAVDDLFADGGDLSDLLGDAGNAALPARARTRAEPPADKPHARTERDRTERNDERTEADDGEPLDPSLEGNGEADDDAQGDAENERARQTEHVRGSRDNPYTVKDLPADKLIELKVDGETLTIPLSELGKSYIREETFHRRIGKVQEQAKEALDGVQRAHEMRARTRESLKTVLEDPEELYAFFMGTEDREKVLEQVATKYAMLRRQHREQPEERLKFQRARDVARLEAERAAWQAEQDAVRQAEQQKVQHERAEKTFRPGWEEGLRKAGFPEPTQALFDEVMVRVNQRMRAGHPITPDDVAEFTYRSCRLLELAPRRGKQRPQPAPQAARPEEPRRANGRRDPWKDVPQRDRIRDPEYFLQGLSRRELGY